MEIHISETVPYVILWSAPLRDLGRSRIELPITQIIGGFTGFPNGWLGQLKVED